MKIKISQYTPREAEQTITKVGTLTRKIILEDLTKICLKSDVIHLTRKDTMLENVVETKMACIRRREARKYIMLILQRMMNLPERNPKNKVTILQVMNNMSRFPLSRETLHMEAVIGL